MAGLPQQDVCAPSRSAARTRRNSTVPVPVSLRGPPFCRCHAVCVTVTIVPVPTRFARHVLSCIRRSPIAHSFIHEYRYLMREAINHHHQRVPDDRGTEGGHRPIVHRRQSNMINISGSSLPWREGPSLNQNAVLSSRKLGTPPSIVIVAPVRWGPARVRCARCVALC